MTGDREDLLEFLGVAADPRLLDQDRGELPEAERRQEPAVSTRRHERLVVAGTVATGVTLIGGAALLLWALWRLLLHGGGVLEFVLAAIGLVFAATHWGWVHVAEYAGVTIDARRKHELQAGRDEWLATVEPYPRFSVTTSVADDATTHVQRVLHRPVLTGHHTFTFVREVDLTHRHAADAAAQSIASDVETMRRQARLQTDRVRESWEAASTAYSAALLSDGDERARLAAQRAAALALSEHINASLLEAPLVE